MAPILSHDPTRELPIYRDGFNAGHDTGLLVALTAITGELARCEDSTDDRCHAYAAGRLHAVGQIVAARFRTPTI